MSGSARVGIVLGIASALVAGAAAVAGETQKPAPATMAHHEQQAAPAPMMPQAQKAAQLWASGDIKWTPDAENQGVSMAVLWGEPDKGAYGAMEKWVGGTVMSLHTHSQDARGVVLSGTMVLTIEGAQPKELGSGSYIYVPANLRHTTACKKGTDCVFFIEQPGAADMHPVAQAAGGPPAKK